MIDTQDAPTRILYLNGDISDNNVSEICKQILNVVAYDNQMVNKYRMYSMEPIQLYIQSFGGSVQDMWSLIDIIESSTTPIITICSGYCMSAAALIFIAGHYRYMYKHSTIMFHQMSVGNYGKISDFKLDQSHFDSMHKDMIKYIKKHTNLKKRFFDKFDKKKEDIYLTAKQCKKYGICDAINKKSDNRDVLLELFKQQNETDCCCEDE
jgi:ATP-dependent Clp protease protease subunit